MEMGTGEVGVGSSVLNIVCLPTWPTSLETLSRIFCRDGILLSGKGILWKDNLKRWRASIATEICYDT